MKPSFTRPLATPSYDRILRRFATFMVGQEAADVGHLVLALLTEESLGSKCLNDLGITVAGIADGCFGQQAADTAMVVIAESLDVPTAVLPFSGKSESLSVDDVPWLQSLQERAALVARQSESGSELSSTHLLQAMVELPGPAQRHLERAGVTREAVLEELFGHQSIADEVRLPVDFELNVDVGDSGEAGDSRAADIRTPSDLLTERLPAVMDANLNRAREGLRVLEDAARFIARDHESTRGLKQLRHDLVAAEQRFRKQCPQTLTARDTEADVGTSLTTHAEMQRERFTDLIAANARRTQEALRSLEEFGKSISGWFAAEMKQLRYRSYVLEQQLARTTELMQSGDTQHSEQRHLRVSRLHAARVYVLISEQQCRLPWQQVVQAALKGGADVIQLREKQMSDDELLRRSLWTAAACRDAGALFILNDRPDLARAAGADGVHVGQDDASIVQSRAALHSSQLLGVSTHGLDDIQRACASGADYLGVGPVFSSVTKCFEEFPGLAFVQQASRHAECPWFAIGGIDHENLSDVRACGATRIAVSHAVIGAADPEQAVRELRNQLTETETEAPQTLPFEQL
ncbi:MAG: thiamine phosphate synthase [Planctomycetaceae bacterium]